MKKNVFTTGLIFRAVLLLVLFNCTQVFADREIATLDYACRTAWNEMCFEQPILKAPPGTKICSYKATELERTGDGNYRIVSIDKGHIELEISAQGSLTPINKTGSSMVVSISLLGVDENDSCITELTEEDSDPVNACVCTNAIDEIEVQWCYSSGKSRSGEDCSTFFSEAICVGTKKACKDHQRQACPNTASIDLVKSRKRLYIKNSPYCTDKQP